MAVLCACAFFAPAKAEPQRIVSLDHCSDRLVTALVPLERVAALSLTYDTVYGPALEADQTFPKVRRDIEAVLAKQPDLVVGQWGLDGKMIERLKAAGLPHAKMPYATGLEALPQTLEDFAKILGAEKEGLALAASMRQKLETLQKRQVEWAGPPPTVLYLTSGGFTAGKDTDIDAMITLAGGENYVMRSGFFQLDVEKLYALKPDFIALGFFDAGLGETGYWGLARTPILKRLVDETPHIFLSAKGLSCQDWYGLEAVEEMANALTRIEK